MWHLPGPNLEIKRIHISTYALLRVKKRGNMAEQDTINPVEKRARTTVSKESPLKVPDPKFESDAKDALQSLQTELDEKRHLISELIDDFKPIGEEIVKEPDTPAQLKQRVDEQEKKIELLKDLVDNKKQFESMSQYNDALKKQVTEKDTLIKVLKDKLNTNTLRMNDLEAQNKVMDKETEEYKKQIFSLDNKIKAIEGRVFSTNDQNQKLLYELMRNKETTQQAEESVANKDALLEKQKQEYLTAVDGLRNAEEEKKSWVIRHHAKKVATLNTTISALRAERDQYKLAMNEKFKKETDMITEFNKKMKDLILTKPDTSQFSTIPPPPGDDDLPPEDLNLGMPEEEPQSAISDSDAAFSMAEVPEPPEVEDENTPSRVDEILPLVELALDHGDNHDSIRHSLHSSGYSKSDVDKAFVKLNIQ